MADQNSGNQGGQNNQQKQSGLSWSQPSSVTKPSQIGTINTPKSVPMLKPAPTTAKTASTGRRTGMLFAAGVLVGGLLTWSWFSMMGEESAVVVKDSNSAAVGETTGASTTTGGTPSALPGATISNEALVIPTPQDAGRSVMITSATVTQPTWVVIYDDKNGVRGNALGAALFFPGGGAKSIKLLRATEVGKTYLVGRHVDNGDKQFSISNDKPVVNAAGNSIYAEFRTR